MKNKTFKTDMFIVGIFTIVSVITLEALISYPVESLFVGLLRDALAVIDITL